MTHNPSPAASASTASTNYPRTRRTLHFHFDAPMSAVFPLLCPVREYDWIDDWQCTLVHTQSGIAEYGCIFQTESPGAPVDTWVVSHYEPPRRIEFVITNALYVTHMVLALAERADGDCDLDWTFTMTGLGAVSSAQLEQIADLRQSVLRTLESALAYYLRTGGLLRREAVSS